jgi:chromosomal replication initiator protein
VKELTGGMREIRVCVADEKSPNQDERELALAYRRTGTTSPQESAARVIAEPVRAPASLAEAGINPKFNFDNYITGPGNSYSAAVARAVAEKPGRVYNPLFFHGGPGLGKTHLLQAIGREVMFRKKRAVVRYVTSEMFTNEFVEAIRRQTLSQFRQRYRKVDVLLIDDVHFFAEKDSTQEEFFHTFNDLFNNTRQIVLASDRPPTEIKGLEDRLVSRFGWGLTAEVQTPDYETRVAILRWKVAESGSQVEPWIQEFIAQRVRTDMRKLEGALMRVAAYISINDSHGKPLTEDLLEAMLRDVCDQEPGRAVNIDRIQRIVAERYDIRMSELLGRGRPKMIAEARQVAMYLTREMTKISLVEVGRAFGGRDHGTVIHAIKVVQARMEQAEDFRALIAELKARISSPAP